MTDEIPAPTETVEKPVETTAQVVEQEKQDEPFDKERAMNTITKLRGIEMQAKKDAKELAQLKIEKQQKADAELSEAQREKKRADDLAIENAKIKTDLWRNEAATAAGIPQMADRLKGTTKEDFLADAQELAKTLPQLKVAPKLPPTNPGNAQTTETDAQKRQRLFGSQQTNVFDVQHIIEHGGGVMDWTTKKDNP